MLTKREEEIPAGALMPPQKHMFSKLVLAVVTFIAAFTMIIPSAAMGAEANAPNFSIAVTPTTETSPTGSDIAYTIKYECSSLSAECSGATIVAQLPQQRDPAPTLFEGEHVTALPGTGRGNGNASTEQLELIDFDMIHRDVK